MVRVIDTLGLTDVVLVGQDSGGMVCRFVAEQRPDAVRALALGGTEIPNVHSPLVKLFKLLAHLPGAKSMFKLTMRNRTLARSPLILGGTMWDSSLINDEFRREVLDPIVSDDDAMKGAVQMIRSFSLEDIDALADVHPKLTMPTLLIFGEDDGFFPVDAARAMVPQFGGPTEFVAIARAKLFVHEEYPERFAEATTAFLRDSVGVS